MTHDLLFLRDVKQKIDVFSRGAVVPILHPAYSQGASHPNETALKYQVSTSNTRISVTGHQSLCIGSLSD